jgi:hypothetical protein
MRKYEGVENIKTKTIMIGLFIVVLTVGLSGCTDETLSIDDIYQEPLTYTNSEITIQGTVYPYRSQHGSDFEYLVRQGSSLKLILFDIPSHLSIEINEGETYEITGIFNYEVLKKNTTEVKTYFLDPISHISLMQ